MRRRRRRLLTTAGIVLGAVALVVAAWLVLSSPRHRSFYFAGSSTSWPPAPARDQTAPGGRAAPGRAAGPGAPIAPPAAKPTFGLPLRFGRTPTPPPESHLVSPTAGAPKARVPRPDADGRIRVPITDDVPATLPATVFPAGWELKEFTGRAMTELVRDDGRVALRLVSDRSSFALYRDVVLDLRQHPILTWSWKAVRLPTGADGRARATDDQGAQVYVIIPRWPFPRINSDVIGYLWDTRAPVGEKVTSPQATNVRSIVLESGYERLGAWVREERNVYVDYVDLFGRKPTRVGKVAVMSDSNDTGTLAEALIDDLIFFRPPTRSARISNVYANMPAMLRDHREP